MKTLYLFGFLLLGNWAFAKDISKVLFDKRYDSDSVYAIAFNTMDGKYIIKPSTDSNAYLKITLIIANDKKLLEFNEKSKLRLDCSASKVTFTQDMGGASGELLYEIYLPKNKIHIDITTKDSPIEISGLTGNNVSLHHVSKAISVESVAGGLYNIVSQSSNLVLKNVNANIKVNTTSSDIDITQTGGSLDAVTEKGNIKFVAQSEFEVNLVSKAGDVDVFIGQEAKFNVNLTSNSKIEYGLNNVLFQGTIAEKTFAGILNNGKTNLKVSAAKGKVTLYNSK